MFAKLKSPGVYLLGGRMLPEWEVTGDELDELRTAIDMVRPITADLSVEWRKASHEDPEHLG